MPVSNQFIENGLKFIARGLGRVGHVLEGKPHIPEKVVQELKEAPHFFKHYARGFIKARGQFVKSLKEDSRYIRIHAAHPDPKIAEVGQIIDEMLNNPLVKKFRRN